MSRKLQNRGGGSSPITGSRPATAGIGPTHTSRVSKAVLLVDIVNSTELTTQLGPERSASLSDLHDDAAQS